MSHDTEQQISALNDLIRINNDRITGYKKRMDIRIDDELEFMFLQFIFQSKQNIEELIKYVWSLGGKPADGKSLSGKFYHAWIDFKFNLTKQPRHIMLDYCENSEDVAKSAYSKALEDKGLSWGKKIANTLKSQLEELKMSHKTIMALRDKTAMLA